MILVCNFTSFFQVTMIKCLMSATILFSLLSCLQVAAITNEKLFVDFQIWTNFLTELFEMLPKIKFEKNGQDQITKLNTSMIFAISTAFQSVKFSIKIKNATVDQWVMLRNVSIWQ